MLLNSYWHNDMVEDSEDLHAKRLYRSTDLDYRTRVVPYLRDRYQNILLC
jgi:hypothetical protein